MKSTVKKSSALLLALIFVIGVLPAGFISFAGKDDFIEGRENYLRNFEFLMYIQEVYTVSGRGTVAEGTVVRGAVKVGDTVWIQTFKEEDGEPVVLAATVESINYNGKTMDEAVAGDKIGLQLSSNITAADITLGEAIVGENSHYVHQKAHKTGSAQDGVFGFLTKNDATSTPIENGQYYYVYWNYDLKAKISFFDHSSDQLIKNASTYAYLEDLMHPATFYVGQKLDIRNSSNTVIGTFTVTHIGDYPDAENGWGRTYLFNFETDEDMRAWTSVASNTEAHGWTLNKNVDFDLPDSLRFEVPASKRNGAAVSYTYKDHHPDNWLISPAITLGENNAVMTFDEAGLGEKNNRYTVYVGFKPDIEQMVPLLGILDNYGGFITDENNNLTESYYFKDYCDLSAFAGKTIYIAFRHHYSWFDDSVFAIDNVEIYEDNGKPDVYNNPFSDVPADSWFTKAALYCNENGFITGTSATTFSPNTELTRAMFVQILARLDGADLNSITYKGKFTDVKEENWFAKAVQWAVDNNLTGGTSETTFSPNAPVTREQLATFFFAYSKFIGDDTSKAAELDKYTDADQISGWAVNAVKWAVAEGLISGTSETTLSPKMSATRAQAAVIFMNFENNHKYSR